MKPTPHSQAWLFLVVMASASWAHSSDPVAETQAHGLAGLKPYTAEYTTTASGMSLSLKRELKRDENDNYTLTNAGKMLVVGFHEVSVFRLQDDHIAPKSYIYQGSGLINRRREVHFTPGAETIRSLYKDEWYELPYTAGTLDRMSQQAQLRLSLLNDPTPKEDITIRVADGKRVKDYTLAFVGEESLSTPLGDVQTLHFERIHDDLDRKSDIWVAPEWDYMMVKTIHVENGKPVEVSLKKASIQGEPISAH
ncbi:MAG: hypothetical protein ACJA09_002150 [Alcanivorax sp.]|jgi:hypothetical protein